MGCTRSGTGFNEPLPGLSELLRALLQGTPDHELATAKGAQMAVVEQELEELHIGRQVVPWPGQAGQRRPGRQRRCILQRDTNLQFGWPGESALPPDPPGQDRHIQVAPSATKTTSSGWSASR